MRQYIAISILCLSGCAAKNPSSVAAVEDVPGDSLESHVDRFQAPDKYGIVCYWERWRGGFDCVQVEPQPKGNSDGR